MVLELLDMAEVCKALRTTPKNLLRWIAKGRFPKPLRVGYSYTWPAAVVKEWMERPYRPTEAGAR